LNNSEEALVKLSTLIKIDPQDSSTWRAKALLSERIGDTSSAIQAWKQAYSQETNAKWADYDLKRLQNIRGY
jgi:Tfp pilus assembly protein PilF